MINLAMFFPGAGFFLSFFFLFDGDASFLSCAHGDIDTDGTGARNVRLGRTRKINV